MLEEVIKYLAEHLHVEIQESEDMYSKDIIVKLKIGDHTISEDSYQLENKM